MRGIMNTILGDAIAGSKREIGTSPLGLNPPPPGICDPHWEVLDLPLKAMNVLIAITRRIKGYT